ncbi:MAG: prepilin-type N-terminal cleavage/methylation domain-containing protein [Deltaproteobacteria bacterium]|nr:prepilin-type N-terminal cleavage/methylation domain-containing protein [Deltaproteobacteria bacterium]
MKKGNEKGFSLIEIMIAIAVFAIGILAVGKMQIMR